MTNIKNSGRGFTIVELLIVIVVIAILAAISIVAYNGIQNRGKASSSQSLASQIAKKVEAFNTIESTYPTTALLKANTGTGAANNPKEAVLDDSSVVVDSVASSPTASGSYVNGSKNQVVYKFDGTTTGGCVYWWDYAASTPIQKGIKVGSGTC